MDIAVASYQLVRAFPKEEQFALSQQIRRAASSVPANIAEGYGRESKGAYIQFLRIAQGSLKELETHLLLAVRVSLLGEQKPQELLESCNRAGRILRALIRALERSEQRGKA